VSGVEWAIRESEYDDRYIKGVTSEGVKIRILTEDVPLHDAGEEPEPESDPASPIHKFNVEVYFPVAEDATPALSNADKRAFMKRLDGHVLAAVKARNVKDE
jgi:hypothetical protein